MGATYYNAIVKFTDGATFRYNDITQIDRFIKFVESDLPPLRVIFFYRKESRFDKKGVYEFYYTSQRGKQFPRQNN